MASSNPRPREVFHLALARKEYGAVLDLQRRLHARRSSGEIADTILTVEHPPVFTLGRNATREHLLVDERTLERERIGVYEIERGGEITYHGPGQLVVYPILDLRDDDRNIKAFIARLEETVLQTVASFGIRAARREGYPGVWVGARKIASVGVYVKHWVTMHGVALNVSIHKPHVRMIRPCGLDIEMVSVADLIHDAPGVTEVAGVFVERFGDVFGRSIRTASLADLEGGGDERSSELDQGPRADAG